MKGYLGLGSNVGDRRESLQAAVDALVAAGIRVIASSSTYDTDPVGDVLDQPDFLNAAIEIDTDLDPEALLDVVKEAETALGKTLAGEQGYVHHGPRPIDIDLLLLGNEEFESSRLKLPHAQVLERRFVLIPLIELDFDLRTPAGDSLADALAAMPVTEGVRRAGPPLRTA
jgi:2-amino-4-hydroxy-6-hydroxymethyldihydropteridine diphosphokinase